MSTYVMNISRCSPPPACCRGGVAGGAPAVLRPVGRDPGSLAHGPPCLWPSPLAVPAPAVQGRWFNHCRTSVLVPSPATPVPAPCPSEPSGVLRSSSLVCLFGPGNPNARPLTPFPDVTDPNNHHPPPQGELGGRQTQNDGPASIRGEHEGAPRKATVPKGDNKWRK